MSPGLCPWISWWRERSPSRTEWAPGSPRTCPSSPLVLSLWLFPFKQASHSQCCLLPKGRCTMSNQATQSPGGDPAPRGCPGLPAQLGLVPPKGGPACALPDPSAAGCLEPGPGLTSGGGAICWTAGSRAWVSALAGPAALCPCSAGVGGMCARVDPTLPVPRRPCTLLLSPRRPWTDRASES